MVIAAINDLSSLFGPIRNQGTRMTCVAFAASDTHAFYRDRWEPLSCEYAYYHAIKRWGSNNPDAGVPLFDMAEAIELDGQPLESGWPYLKTLPQDLSLWKPPPDPGDIFYRKIEIKSPSLQDIVDLIDSGDPVIVTLNISISFSCPDSDGYRR